tara:strand:+ start:1783 stop:2712 length:930 start_codon:yes stop_codon:yes gene_type:complete
VDKLNCAVVGCGKIAQGYDSPEDRRIRTHVKAYLDNANCNLVGVCDLDKNKLQDLQSRWGLIPIFNNLELMLSSINIDLLSICTPTEFHLESFKAAAYSNIKQVWMEKPSSYDSASIQKMIEVESDKGMKVYVNYFRRYDIGFAKVKEALDDLGRVSHVIGYYSKGMKNNASHLVDLLVWLFGKASNQELLSDLSDDFFPSASFKLEFNDTNAHIFNFDYKNYEIFELDIIGSKGRIKILDGGKCIEFYEVSDSKHYASYKNLIMKEKHKGSLDVFMQKGLKKILGSDHMPTLQEDLYIQILMDKLLTS